MYKKANPEGYALALFELAQEDKIEKEIHALMIELKNAIQNDNLFINNLITSEISNEKKYKYIEDIFKDIKNSTLIINFLKVLVEKNSANLLNRIISLYLKLSNEVLKIKFAKIYSAFEISEEKLEKIKAKLEKKFNSKIELDHEIDKNLISGFRIKIDSQVIEQNFDFDLKSLEQILLKKGGLNG
ncbi:ATP synthase F1 subunit delta [Mycoplasmopsis lipofaciens]|uniref:ATP synthase F1 subunit delta n=1 Tax=Mycoplasmopsis lipofaciens TaxID=114884 RepID=UPI0004853FD0|nr:ATP synthase F1 subunit delta [Mycoplasmopsis lipofaciens]